MDEGLKTALARIEKEAQEKTGELDLRGLGLTEIPPEVFELTHLTKLDVGYLYNGENNTISVIPDRISNLKNLTELNINTTGIKSLNPLKNLTTLQYLDCSNTQVDDLAPLKNLTALQSLSCGDMQVDDLAPLKNLTALQSLYCGGTQVDDLAPLKNLTALQYLYCYSTHVDDLAPLKSLTALQSLYCSNTQVDDLAPLKNLLQCDLTTLFVDGCPVKDVPPELLSPFNCAAELKAHFEDLGDNPTHLNQFKILILGNGRVGKTQIARILRDKDMKPDDVSTHAIRTTSHDIFHDQNLPKARLWDFGGQDIYHGTHALFMKGRAVNILAWNPGSENTDTHTHDGQTFKNEKLPYWIEFIRRLSGHDNPLIITQTRCDEFKDAKPEIASELLEPFDFHQKVEFDAASKNGYEDLLDNLRIAQRKIPRPLIGPGRLAVKEAIEEIQSKEPHRKLLPFTEFEAMCKKSGGVSDPRLFADYLHHADVFFYRQGLFGDQIVLDTNWMMEAIYAVLNRDVCKLEIERSDGRFTLNDLGRWMWNEDYCHEEQAQFLHMMRATGICFRISPGYYWNDNEEDRRKITYIAPELLPTETPDLTGRWDEDADTTCFDIAFNILPAPVFRAVMSELGQKAGLNGVYWRTGLWLFETKHKSAGQITLSTSEDGFAGTIHVQTQGGDAQSLCNDLMDVVYEVAQAYGFTPKTDKPERAKARRELTETIDPDTPDKSMAFGQKPPIEHSKEIFVSYSHANAAYPDLVKDVNRLCQHAIDRDIKVWRDTEDVNIGQSIDVFMSDLAQSRRCFVFLSEKYLCSDYCMDELHQLWRWNNSDGRTFHETVRVYNIDADILSEAGRKKITDYWLGRLAEYDTYTEVDFKRMSKARFAKFKNIEEFANNTDDILAHIASTVLPESFEAFLEHGFEGL